MKKNKVSAILSVALGGIILTACTSPDYKVKFSENWYLDTSYTIRPSVQETLVYDVAFEALSNADTSSRAVIYGKGVYSTTLTSEYSETYGENVYRYTTNLEIPVTFECKTSGEISEKFTDVVTSEVLFTSAIQGLRPIYSKKTAISHSPTSVDSPVNLAGCYTYYNYTVEVNYNDDLSGKAVLTNHLKEDTQKTYNFTQSDEKYSTLDNEQLLLALRGISNLSSQKFNVFNSSWGKSLLVNITANTSDSDEFTFKRNGEDYKATIKYTPVELQLGVENSGSTQTVWLANTTELNNNIYRNVILYMEMPVYYSLGTFQYKLTQANFIA